MSSSASTTGITAARLGWIRRWAVREAGSPTATAIVCGGTSPPTYFAAAGLGTNFSETPLMQ